MNIQKPIPTSAIITPQNAIYKKYRINNKSLDSFKTPGKVKDLCGFTVDNLEEKATLFFNNGRKRIVGPLGSNEVLERSEKDFQALKLKDLKIRYSRVLDCKQIPINSAKKEMEFIKHSLNALYVNVQRNSSDEDELDNLVLQYERAITLCDHAIRAIKAIKYNYGINS